MQVIYLIYVLSHIKCHKQYVNSVKLKSTTLYIIMLSLIINYMISLYLYINIVINLTYTYQSNLNGYS